MELNKLNIKQLKKIKMKVSFNEKVELIEIESYKKYNALDEDFKDGFSSQDVEIIDVNKRQPCCQCTIF